MKPWKAPLVTLVAVAMIIAMYGVSLLRRGFSARQTPSFVESLIATTARRLALPSEYRTLRNPLPASPENIQAGMEHFADHCAVCHSNDGNGDTMFGKGLYPKPPDMRGSETQSKSDGELYYTIENGIRLSGMPAFGEQPARTGDRDTWKLVLFIRHLPVLSEEEQAKMAGLNPKTETDRQEEKQEQDFLNEETPPTGGNGAHRHH